MASYTLFSTPLITPCLRLLSRFILRVSGWKIEGEIPAELKRCVIIGAPHTTNWDLPISLMIAFSLNSQLNWMGKASIFRFPFGGIMRWLGGIPVDREKTTNLVAATVEQLSTQPELRILIAPEGTRAKTKGWKSGFYYMADGAKVPLVLAFVDYPNKRGGIGKIMPTSGNFEADMQTIMAFYQPLMKNNHDAA